MDAARFDGGPSMGVADLRAGARFGLPAMMQGGYDAVEFFQMNNAQSFTPPGDSLAAGRWSEQESPRPR